MTDGERPAVSTHDFAGLRVALVHDWLTGMRGGEKVLEELCRMFPAARLHTLMHVPGTTSPVIEAMDIRTSWIQRLPLAERRFRGYLPLFPAAIESFDLRGFDLVVSTSHCVAKGVIADPAAVHVSYVFTPMRYAWDLAGEYFHPRRSSRWVRALAPLLLSRLRTWDVASSARVDRFVACSAHIRKRIHRFYRRDATVVHAPVDTDSFTVGSGPRRHILIVSALVPYKAIELALEAAADVGLPLLVVGSGPERGRLEAMAPANARFLGAVPGSELLRLYREAALFLLPGEEDFGIAALEAQACGTPVVAYGRGGALETVIDGVTGRLFGEPTRDALLEAMAGALKTTFDADAIRDHALGFSRARFVANLSRELASALGERRP